MTNRSLWWDQLPVADRDVVRPGLAGDTDADVAIVGAGYTGLWTAHHLHRLDPSLRVVVLEKEVAGFGASGRNGGWCSDLFPASWDKIARQHGRDAALRQKAAMRDSIEAVRADAAGLGIDCDFTRGGTLGLARSEVQLDRARAEVEHGRSWGDGPEDLSLLSAAETAARTGASDVLGATFTPHCAALQPAKLVRGLATAVAEHTPVHEHTTVSELRPGLVVTDRGTVRAPVVVRATEGYTAGIRGHRRDLAPVYSLIVATEPLPEELLGQVGLSERPTFTDHRHLICYGQRTLDGRIVFGGRGAPYHLGSRTSPEYDLEPAVFSRLEKTVVELFPMLAGVTFTHRWGGPLGIPRDWHAGVGYDPSTGFAWAGGYVGDGVSTANLAGRTLADLITGTASDLVDLPWVGHRSRKWEPEPFRYLGINAGLLAMSNADRTEARTGRPSKVAAGFSRLLGG